MVAFGKLVIRVTAVFTDVRGYFGVREQRQNSALRPGRSVLRLLLFSIVVEACLGDKQCLISLGCGFY